MCILDEQSQFVNRTSSMAYTVVVVVYINSVSRRASSHILKQRVHVIGVEIVVMASFSNCQCIHYSSTSGLLAFEN